MKTFARLFSLAGAFLFFFNSAMAADTNSPPRAMVELHDGSRIVGPCVDEKLKFHSALLGDIKLPVESIRSLDCQSTNSVILYTAEGDTIAVSFQDRVLDVKTSFGKVTIPVDSIRKLTFTGDAEEAHLQHRPGLVALWSGDNKGKDSIGTNDTIWTDVSYADGLTGQAFALNGVSSFAEIPASSALDVGEGDGMTLSVWIKPNNVSGFHPIMEWEKTTSQIGVQLWIGQYPSSEGVVCAFFMDPDGNNYVQVASPPMTLQTGLWQHIAVTYDRSSGFISLYVNGTLVNQHAWGNVTPFTTGSIWISRRPGDHPGDWTYNAFFAGLLDRLAIYNRALSGEEIKSICLQDNNGKMPPPPDSQPGL